MNYTSSYILYISTVLLSTLFAHLAQVFKQIHGDRTRPHPLFWSLSFFTLWFIVGFRYEVGFDYYNYQAIYEQVQRYGFLGYYHHVGALEPGYLLLGYLTEALFHDFSALFICSSFIALFFFYKAFSYEIDRMSLALCVFVFASTQYFYYFGIDRLFVAVSIVTFAYRYILSGKKKTYLAWVIFAALFHFSALFMYFLPFLFKLQKDQPKLVDEKVINDTSESQKTDFFSWISKTKKPFSISKSASLLFFVILPLFFMVLARSIPHMPDKYLGYSDLGDIRAIALSVLLKLPVLFLFLVFSRRLITFNVNNYLYLLLYGISIVVQLCTIIVPVGRLNWYMWISICFLFSSLISSFSRSNVFLKICIVILLLAYCMLYSTRAYFLETWDSPQGNVMLPYKNLFFDLPGEEV